jgi:predicted transcriptional regulator
MILGELEKAVLHYFWRNSGAADAKRVHAHFSKRRGGTLNTIQSTLDRLYRKGLLTRYKEGHAFHYQAAIDRKAFIGSRIQHVLKEYARDHDDGMLAAFVSLSSQLDARQLAKLEQMIREFREQGPQEEQP